MRLIKLFFVLLITLAPVLASAQLSVTDATDTRSIFEGDPVQMINEISSRIGAKRALQEKLQATAKEQGSPLSAESMQELSELQADINQLQQSLVLSITGSSALGTLYDQPDEKTTWQEDIVDVIKPLADSLKNLTRRPRQIAELRSQLLVIDDKQLALKDALEKFSLFDKSPLQKASVDYIGSVRAGWADELQQLEGEELIVTRQLQGLVDENDKPFSALLPNVKRFFLGTGLTLLFALLAAVITYFFMRSIWWLYSNKIASKDTRRKSTLYRLSSYSYHFVTGIFVLISILLVLYAREDLLLLAVAFLLLTGLLLSLKQFLPKYVSEARLLLNLGSVREDERVVYNGLPWQVKAINLYSVLHNPALDGIIRLPLGVMSDLVSRPVRNNLWFPTQRNDFVILPDGVLGQIKYQTPDLVEVTVRGGMAQTFTTADFYTLNITNLCRDETFGVSVTFGLDYGLQQLAVKEIPEALHAAVTAKLVGCELGKHMESLIVELASANTSSLDFLIFATFKKTAAGNYYKIERLILQACVELSNERRWTIPFPQLTIHNAPVLA